MSAALSRCASSEPGFTERMSAPMRSRRLRAQAVRLARVAAAAFFDHALHGRDRERDAARLDALQVERREQAHVLRSPANSAREAE